ncbi:MAG: tetratricopeptide repeat protein [Bacteroidota bacterium]|nr:tetratricopeptide repeat protein [Bacteroidota bacterium]
MRINVLIIVLVLFACSSPDSNPDVAILIQASQEALNLRDYHEALSLADSAITLDDRSADAHFMRGRIYFELQQWDNAEAAYLAVIKIERDYPGVRHNLGNIYYGQRQNRQALDQFIQAINDSAAAMSWHAVGAVYNVLSEPDSAVAAFRQAIVLDSLYAPAHTSLADWLEQQGSYTESLAHTRMALSIRPNHLADQVRQGRLLLRLGRSEEAVPLLQDIVIRYPRTAEPQYVLGQVLQQLGKSDQSSRILAKADSLRAIEQAAGRLANTANRQPTNFQAQVDYATALRRSGRTEEALKVYLIARALRPNNINLRFHIANAKMALGSLEEAEQELLYILAADSSYVLAWLSLREIYARTNRTALAREAWQKAFLIDPDHPAVQRLARQ